MFTRYARGMVYWADLPSYEQNPNVQAGRRPVIIISNNISNLYSKLVTVVPCTTNTDKPEQPTHTIINLDRDEDSLVLCEMILTVNKNLLSGFMGMLDEVTMKKIDSCIAIQLDLQLSNIIKPVIQPEIKKEQPTLEQKRKKNAGKRVNSLQEMSEFLHYVEQNGVEKTMAEYGIPTATAVQQRIGYYKRKIKRGAK